MSTLEEQVSTYFDALTARLDQPATEPYPIEMVPRGRRSRFERRRRLRRQAVALALGSVAAAVLVAVWVTRPDDRVPPAATIEDHEPSWTELQLGSAIPVVNRSATAVSSGSLLVWGGDDVRGVPGDDAGYLVDLESGDVRRTTPAPIGERSGAASVAVDDRFVILGGVDAQGQRTDGAIYDPGSDIWQPIASAPIQGTTGHLVQTVRAGDDIAALVQLSATTEAGQPAASGWAVCVLDSTALEWAGCLPVAVPYEVRVVMASNGTDVLVLTGQSAEVTAGPSFTINELSLDALTMSPVGGGTIPTATTGDASGDVPIADSLAGASFQPDGVVVVWGHQETVVALQVNPNAQEAASYRLPLAPSECPLSAAPRAATTYLIGCDNTVLEIDAQAMTTGTLPAGGELLGAGPATSPVVLLSAATGSLRIWTTP